MRTIEIEVKEDYFPNILEILKNLKSVMIENIKIDDTKLEAIETNDPDYKHFEIGEKGEFRDFNSFLKDLDAN
jgi:hypothetical protein